jgi:hypothetical protein
MSVLAKDLMELRAIRGTGHGALVEHLLREIALILIAGGVRDESVGG